MSVRASELGVDGSLDSVLREHYEQLRFASHFHQYIVVEDFLVELLRQLQQDSAIVGLQYEPVRSDGLQPLSVGRASDCQCDFQLGFAGESLGRLLFWSSEALSDEAVSGLENVLMSVALAFKQAVTVSRLQSQLAAYQASREQLEQG